MLWPPATGTTVPVWARDSLMPGVAVPETVAVRGGELFDVTGSNWLPETVAALANDPAAVGLTATMKYALAPGAIEPRFTPRSVPLSTGAEPWLAWSATKVVPAGRKSLSVALVAVFGPLLVTVRT